MLIYIKIKKLTILLLLININFMLSQNFESIKRADTVYVYFKKTNANPEQVSDTGMHAFNYIYSSGYYNALWFYDASVKNNLVLKKKKSFFKKNKDIIITYQFLKPLSYEEATHLFDKKVVFLIDKKDVGWFTIKLIKVKIAGSWEPSIE